VSGTVDWPALETEYLSGSHAVSDEKPPVEKAVELLV
jgi:hypothetical protein